MLQFSCGHCSLEQQVKQTDPAQNSLNEGTMRLTADPLDEKGKPWNDGQEDKTFRWYGEHGKKGYLYEIYARLDNRRITILVSDETVWIDFLDGGSIHTNIRPKGLFKKKKSLSWKEIIHIINLLEKTDIEGKVYSKKEIDNYLTE